MLPDTILDVLLDMLLEVLQEVLLGSVPPRFCALCAQTIKMIHYW